MKIEKDYQIPRVIHYFWLGGNEKPDSVKKCIESWKKNCPDFEIKEWNESNYDIHKHPYMEKAYAEKKWAFVPDYGRLDVMHQYGGIYMDTDVEVLKDLSSLCKYKAFKGFESKEYVNDGQGFGCVPGLPIFKSKDCVKWEQIGNIIDRPSQLDFSGDGVSRGLFAPTIRYNNGKFYCICTHIDKIGNFFVTADNPAGPWSDPIVIEGADGIDPSLFFDG